MKKDENFSFIIDYIIFELIHNHVDKDVQSKKLK